MVATLQALSGAGLQGISSVEALGNVIPFIPGEEEKIASEPLKIPNAEFTISVAVHRVPVIDGHTMTAFVKLKKRVGIASIERAMKAFVRKPPSTELPSAPRRPLHLLTYRNRPQPARDAMRGDGMVVSIGRIQPDPVYDARFTLVVHNTVRGAAGAAILNAELVVESQLSAVSFQRSPVSRYLWLLSRHSSQLTAHSSQLTPPAMPPSDPPE